MKLRDSFPNLLWMKFFISDRLCNTLKEIGQNGIKTDQGIKNFTAEEATKLAGSDSDWFTRDLFEAIKRKEYSSWTVCE